MSDERKQGIELIAEERRRQVEGEGFTAKHDDGHNEGELAAMAVCFAAPGPVFVMRKTMTSIVFEDPWPIGGSGVKWDKRLRPGTTRVELLTKAGALIAAEIDRLQRGTIR